MTARLHVTRIRKAGGALLCKRISLGQDGKPVSDGSPCAMTRGTATRVVLDEAAPATSLAALISELDQSEALALGDHVAEAKVIEISKAKDAEPKSGRFGRTLETFRFQPGIPAVVLLDFDRKGMPRVIAELLEATGGFEAAIAKLLQGEYGSLARVVRASTSAGIYNQETGEPFPAGGGLHLYLLVRDGADVPRFLRNLQARAWLAGFGWIMVAGRGALLTRSIVDITVGSPERLVFEGPPLIVAPLAQDLKFRQPIAHDGELIDTRVACPDLSAWEEREFNRLVEAARAELKPQAEEAKEAAAERLAKKRDIPIESARKVVATSANGELVSWDSVDFDDPDLSEVEIADILANPDRFDGETLADPLEGLEYGTGKAKLYDNGGGDVRINSFAHGGQKFKLGHSFDFIAIEIEKAGEEAPERLAELMPFAAKLTDVERERLVGKAAKLGKVSKTAVKGTVKEQINEAARKRAERRARRARAEAAEAGEGSATSRGAAFSTEPGDPFAEFHAAVDRVNRDFFVCQFAGAVPICTFHDDPELRRRHLAFMKPADFRLKFLTETYLVGFKRDGGELWRDLGTGWMESKRRRQYDRAGMFPRCDAPPNTLNLWQGWGVEPKPGSWDAIAWHLLHIICNSDQELCDYLVGLLAYWVQNPEKVGEVAIVLRGKKGSGKGTLADVIRQWFRHHSVHVTQSRHLTGNFNAHLADCLFLFADEVTWGGDKQGEGALKGLITEKTIQIEPKGINCFSLRNRIKVLIASNSDWVVPVTEDERRFLVLDVSEAKRGNREYFDKLHAAIEGGEAAAMLHDLLHLDLSGFSHRDVPHTDGLNAQKVEGLDSVGRWWMSCLDEGRIVGGPAYENSLGETVGSAHWPGEMSKARLHYAYVQHCQSHGERHPKDEARFPKAWKRFAPSMDDYKPLGQPRRWKFQSLKHHRDEFMQAMNINGWDWRTVDDHGEELDEKVAPFPAKEGSR